MNTICARLIYVQTNNQRDANIISIVRSIDSTVQIQGGSIYDTSSLV